MLDPLFTLLLTAWAAGLGLRLIGRVGPTRDDPANRLALAVPIGLGMLALAVLGLGEVGSLSRPGIVAVLAIGAVLGAGELRKVIDWASRGIVWPVGRVGWAVDGALAAGIVGSLLTALTPVTDGDALCYHLQVSKVFLEKNAALYEPDLHETAYPLVTEMLYAVALAFRGPVACRLVQWVLGLAFAANVAAVARPILGTRARWAAAVALLVPAVSNGMAAPLNDVALACFGNAALHAWIRWLERPMGRSAALAGVLAGMALGVKFPALVWVAILGGAMVALAGLARIRSIDAEYHRPRFRHVLIFGIVAVAVGSPWYLRAYRHTGNPVHPFFRTVFGAGLDEVLVPSWRPLPVDAVHLATAIAPLTLEPEKFDSLAHQFGPAFLLFLPGLLLFRPPARVAGVAALGWCFLTLCLTQRQSMRFLLIAVGPMAVAVAWVAVRACERRSMPGRLLAGLLVGILAFEAAIAVGHARHGIGVVLGSESAEAYLERREPTYRVGRWIAANLPEPARLIGQEHRGFYLPRPYAMERAHRRRTGLGTRGESAEEIAATLRAEGFTHLLLCPPEPEGAVEFDPTLSRRLAPWLERRRPLYREAIVDPDGVLRRYAIYDLATGVRR